MNLWTWKTGHWESQSGLLFGWTSKHPWHHLTHFEAERQTCILPISFCSRLVESPLDGFYICSSSGFVRKQGVHIYIYICVCFVHPNNALVDHHLPNFQWPSFGVYPIFIHLIYIYNIYIIYIYYIYIYYIIHYISYILYFPYAFSNKAICCLGNHPPTPQPVSSVQGHALRKERFDQLWWNASDEVWQEVTPVQGAHLKT